VVVIIRKLDLQLPVQSVPMTTNVVRSNPDNGEVYSIQHCVVQFVSHMRQIGGFHWATPVSSTNKTEILLKVALSILILRTTHSSTTVCSSYMT